MADNKVMTLSDQLRFAKSKVVAYMHIRDTGERQLADIADERRQLDLKEQLIVASQGQVAEGIIERSQKEVEVVERKLADIVDRRISGGSGRPSGRRKLEKKMERHQRLVKKMNQLIEEKHLSEDEIELFLTEIERSRAK